MTNVAAERDAFEAWYARRHPKPTHENSTWAHCAKMDDWEVWQARAGAAPAAVAGPAPATFMTKDQACEWAWDKVREEVGTKGWTTGDSCNFYGFFLHGWNYRGQYELQRSTAMAALKQELMTAAPALEAPAAPASALQREAELLATILRSLAPEGSVPEGVDLYAPDFAPSDGDVFVQRAAQVLEALAAAPQAPAAPAGVIGWVKDECTGPGAFDPIFVRGAAPLPAGYVANYRPVVYAAAPAAPAVDASELEWLTKEGRAHGFRVLQTIEGAVITHSTESLRASIAAAQAAAKGEHAS